MVLCFTSLPGRFYCLLSHPVSYSLLNHNFHSSTGDSGNLCSDKVSKPKSFLSCVQKSVLTLHLQHIIKSYSPFQSTKVVHRAGDPDECNQQSDPSKDFICGPNTVYYITSSKQLCGEAGAQGWRPAQVLFLRNHILGVVRSSRGSVSAVDGGETPSWLCSAAGLMAEEWENLREDREKEKRAEAER